MTEPVAYIYNYVNGDYALWHKTEQHIEKAIPLYTKEQLHPRVKMTQAEFDEWKELYEDRHATTIYDFIIYVLNRSDSYPDMTNKLMYGSGAVKAKSQAKIGDLIVNYNPDAPEETIEIVPDIKWFVRSKEPDDEVYYAFLENLVQLKLNWCYSKDKQKPHKTAVKFGTQEEAEEWTNPLTEAVLLPVEE